MNRIEAESVVSSVGWLSRQPSAFRGRFLQQAELREVSAGNALYALGDDHGGIFGLASGTLEVLIAPGPFPPMLALVARPGWWVGDAALISRTPRRVGITARTDCQVLFVSEASVEAMARVDPVTWRRIAEITVGHVDNVLALAACLMPRDGRSRLLATLCRLAIYDMTTEDGVEIAASHEELGEMASLSRNMVSRILDALAGDGLIEKKYGRIRVPDIQALIAEMNAQAMR